MEISAQVLNEILSLRKITNIRNLIAGKGKHPFLSQKDIGGTTKKDIINQAHGLNARRLALPCGDDSLAQKWMWGEQKLLIWVAIYYVGSSNIEANAMGQEQFQKIMDLFPSKSPAFLRYELALAFTADPRVHSQWTQEEVLLLKKIHSEERGEENRWKRISYKLFRESEGAYFKPAENCRNRWENHIDPSLLKSPWTAEEDLRMLECIMENGTRWALIAKKACKGRNEHMVKNRFRSLIRKFKINQKGKTTSEICLALTRKIPHSPIKAQEESRDQETPVEYNQIAPCIVGESQMTKQGEVEQGDASVEPKGLSAAQIMEEINRKEFGENHRYMVSLDDCWIDRIMESHSSIDESFDFCRL